MRKSACIFAAGVAVICFGTGPAEAGEFGPLATRAMPNVPVEFSAPPEQRDVEVAAYSAMAAAAVQALDARSEKRAPRPPREVAPTGAELRAAMIDGARRELSRRWPGSVFIPETPGADAFRFCMFKGHVCFNVKIKIDVELQ